MLEKCKVDGIKRDYLELQEIVEKLFQHKLSIFKGKCENILSKSYTNSMVHIEKLEKEIKNKDQIINHLLVSLENLTWSPNKSVVINNAVTSPGLEIQTGQIQTLKKGQIY